MLKSYIEVRSEHRRFIIAIIAQANFAEVAHPRKYAEVLAGIGLSDKCAHLLSLT